MEEREGNKISGWKKIRVETQDTVGDEGKAK